jgi:hypothetical protein
MNYKIVILIALLIVAGLAAGYFYIYPGHRVQEIAQNTEIVITDKKITDNTKPFKIDITYPQVAGQDEFNKMVQDIVDKEISDFKKNSLENDNAVKKVDPASYEKYPREYDLQISYDKGTADENTISVVINIYNFEGGAHGASYSKAINYSPKEKREIKLADLFIPSQANYLKIVSDFSIKDLTKQIDPGMLDSSWINEGAGPKEENYSVFLINKNDITFYFQQYQVAAGAAGSFKVIFPK